MPTAIDAAVAGTSANSYVTVAAADTYFGDRLDASSWTGASTDDKTRALLQATRRLDLEQFEGWKSAQGQALKWPRENVYNEDGFLYASDAIPTIVAQAEMELALYFLNADSDALADTGLEGFNRVKVASIEAEPRHNRKAGALPQVVKDLLRDVSKSAGNRIVLT